MGRHLREVRFACRAQAIVNGDGGNEKGPTRWVSPVMS